MMKIARYITEQHIIFLDGDSRDEVLKKMIDFLDQQNLLKDRNAFSEAILDREDIVSTGIGMGVAIPHAKLSGYNDFFIAIGSLSKGVDWHSLDDAPVRLIFMIGGPDDKQTEYLQILSSLTLAIKDENRRQEILQAKDVETIVKLFEEF